MCVRREKYSCVVGSIIGNKLNLILIYCINLVFHDLMKRKFQLINTGEP